MTEVEQPPPQNGIDLSANEDDDHNKSRPADIEQDMREMERRKRVEAIMGSKLFREELERIVDSARDGSGTSGILQQLSDIVGLPAARIGSVYKASNCLMPINDIRGVESMGYAKGEKILRCKLAATFRLLDLYGWTQGLGAQITARLKVDQEYFLVNPYGLLYHEITASSLNKVDMQGNIVEQGTTNFGVNKSHFVLHSVVHAARPDIRCAIYIGCSPVVAVSSLKAGLLPITRDACVLGEITTHAYTGILDNDERDRLIRNLGPNSKVMLLTNHGALCCGETIEEAFYAACHIVQACETQLKLLPVGLENLSLIPEESCKVIYEQARRPPEDLEKKFAAAASANDTQDEHNTTTSSSDAPAAPKIGQAPKWRVGGAEFEALMRMLDNAGYRTGYIYRHPLIKSDPPKPKNDVELPPAVSSLGYLLEEEELFRQGIWKKGDIRKGGDRSRWLNSPNVYQKVEVLETGTPDPKKITKWVAEGSPSHSTPVRIEDPLQFVPAGTNPKEFKRLQQQIKDNRRADKISAGPQSHILEGVTWDEAARIRDANVSATGDHVVLMGAASKGIIQRGFQHNATVYKAPYAKNPFDNVTDDELNEYKRTVERKKKSIHGEYTDTDFSESEALSSLPAGQQGKHGKRAGAQSEPEDMGAHQVMRIETQQAPIPSQPEVVLSDALNNLEIRRPKFYQQKQQKHEKQQQIKETQIEQRNKASQANEEELQHEARKIKLIQELHKMQLFQALKAKFSTNDFSSSDQEEKAEENKAKELLNNKRRTELIVDKLGRQVESKKNNDNHSSVNDSTTNQKQTTKELSKANWSKQTFFLPFVAVAGGGGGGSRGGATLHHHHHYQQPKNQKTQLKYTRKIELNQQALQQQHQQGCYDHNNQLAPYNTTLSDSCSSYDTRAESMNFCCNYFSYDSIDTSFDYFAQNENKPPTQKFQKLDNGSPLHDAILPNNRFEPYRTVSHFGFISPRKLKQPEHKHLPTTNTATTLYRPLRKSRSLGEVFASQQLSEFCDECFEKALSCRTNWGPLKLENYAGEHNVYEEDTASSQPIYDYVYANRPLEPLVELDESKIMLARKEDDHEHEEIYATASSSFLDKIMRLNYSEESTNVCFTPHPVTSSLSIDVGVGEIAQNADMIECMPTTTVCITEIWDFGNWHHRIDSDKVAADDLDAVSVNGGEYKTANTTLVDNRSYSTCKSDFGFGVSSTCEGVNSKTTNPNVDNLNTEEQRGNDEILKDPVKKSNEAFENTEVLKRHDANVSGIEVAMAKKHGNAEILLESDDKVNRYDAVVILVERDKTNYIHEAIMTEKPNNAGIVKENTEKVSGIVAVINEERINDAVLEKQERRASESEAIITEKCYNTEILLESDGKFRAVEQNNIEPLDEALVSEDNEKAENMTAAQDNEKISEKAKSTNNVINDSPNSSIKKTMKNLCSKMVKFMKHDKQQTKSEEGFLNQAYVDEDSQLVTTADGRTQDEQTDKELDTKVSLMSATTIFYVIAEENETQKIDESEDQQMETGNSSKSSSYQNVDCYVEPNLFDEDDCNLEATNGSYYVEQTVDVVGYTEDVGVYVDQENCGNEGNDVLIDEADTNEYADQYIDTKIEAVNDYIAEESVEKDVNNSEKELAAAVNDWHILVESIINGATKVLSINDDAAAIGAGEMDEFKGNSMAETRETTYKVATKDLDITTADEMDKEKVEKCNKEAAIGNDRSKNSIERALTVESNRLTHEYNNDYQNVKKIDILNHETVPNFDTDEMHKKLESKTTKASTETFVVEEASMDIESHILKAQIADEIFSGTNESEVLTSATYFSAVGSQQNSTHKKSTSEAFIADFEEKSDLSYYVDQEANSAKSATRFTDDFQQLQSKTNTNHKPLKAFETQNLLLASSFSPIPLHNGDSLPTLMTRDERLKRKSEFQELWEDHVAFFNGKNQQQDSDAEDINPKQPKKATPKIINSTFETELPDEEVFYGQSSIYYLSPTQTKRRSADESTEDGRESTATFNMDDQTINIENLFDIKSAYNLENDMRRFQKLQRKLFEAQKSNSNDESSTSDDNDGGIGNELTEQERSIIKNIRDNKLKLRADGEIFEKIEHTIINKLTPRRIADLMNQQQKLLQQEDNSSDDDATPSRMTKKTRRTRSRSRQMLRTRLDYVSAIEEKAKLNANAAPIKNRTISNSSKEGSKRSTMSPILLSSSSSSIVNNDTLETKKPASNKQKPPPHHKRNFIRENIKNASKSNFRRTSVAPTTTANSQPPLSSPQLTSSEQQVPEVEVFQSITSASIYPFQTKLVHGSPLLWVSLSPRRDKAAESAFKKSKTPLLKQRLRKRKIKTDDEQPSCSRQSAQKLDLQLDALNDKMLDINTRLQSIELKDKTYGDNLNKCSEIVDECAELQHEVALEQQNLQREIALNQYAEEIMCRAQTYSLSATED